MSTNVKRATRKGLLPDYYSILVIIFNIIDVFFSKTFFVLFCFPSNMAAKYAVRHLWRHAKVVYFYFFKKTVSKTKFINQNNPFQSENIKSRHIPDKTVLTAPTETIETDNSTLIWFQRWRAGYRSSLIYSSLRSNRHLVMNGRGGEVALSRVKRLFITGMKLELKYR